MLKRSSILKQFVYNFLFLFIYSTIIVAQPEEKPFPSKRDFVFIETNFIPSDSGFTCFISYRAPYNNLIFVKSGDQFTSSLTLYFELKNKNIIVDRKSTTKNVIVDSYNSTLSQTDYLEGVLKLDLGRNDYTLNSSASLSNGDNNIPLDSILLSQKEIIKSGFLKPIIVMKDKSVCGEEFPFRLINFANTIPFIAESVDMLLPVIDTSVTQIGIKIEQEKKIIIEKKISENYKSNLAFKECDNKISFEKAKNGSAIKYFYLSDFNQNLKEGPVTISVTAGKSTPVDFNVRVVWNDKPKSLATPELAIQILRAIESEEVVDSILSADKDQYNIALNEYWNKKFPNKNSVFNKYELEFYRRADQAIEKFTTLAVKNGALSDRGKTYIRYGEPDEIKRDYNNDNMAIEIWYYDRTNKAFLFTDKTGLGNFMLGQ